MATVKHMLGPRERAASQLAVAAPDVAHCQYHDQVRLIDQGQWKLHIGPHGAVQLHC